MANRWGNNGNSDRFIFLGSKITANGDCSHEIKTRLLLGRKVMTNLDSMNSLLDSVGEGEGGMIWEPPKIKSVTVSIVSPSISHEVMGLDAIILFF